MSPAHCSQDAIWDHAQDHRKNYSAPEPVKQPINAMEVAILVQSVPLLKGAELIENFARAEHQRIRIEERLDAVAAGARP